MFQYPRGKLVMTAPVELPIVGKVQFRNTSKEELLKFWTDACNENGLNIRYQERVEAIEKKDGVFHVTHQPTAVHGVGRAARDRPARHAAQARRAGRGAAQGRLSADRSGAVPRPAR